MVRRKRNRSEKENRKTVSLLMRYYIILIVTFFLSCNSQQVYEDYVDLDEGVWYVDSVKTFEFEIPKATTPYKISATFRSSSRYLFYNLYFSYTLKDSLGNPIAQKQKELILFDKKTGKPLGDGLGDMFDHEIVVDSAHTFNNTGKYSIDLQQFMRLDTLPFIFSVGTRVIYANEQ